MMLPPARPATDTFTAVALVLETVISAAPGATEAGGSIISTPVTFTLPGVPGSWAVARVPAVDTDAEKEPVAVLAAEELI
ncbi:hypothetical protein SDC9_113851 [bioreactor metagenome]|uniref:Uncharacterized protein n=1 Tax=bioreactor metagenome TaxID=1076179 RepID=A0A645BNX2_9ZZZZ